MSRNRRNPQFFSRRTLAQVSWSWYETQRVQGGNIRTYRVHSQYTDDRVVHKIGPNDNVSQVVKCSFLVRGEYGDILKQYGNLDDYYNDSIICSLNSGELCRGPASQCMSVFSRGLEDLQKLYETLHLGDC